MPDKTIALKTPVDWHGKPVTEIVLREPKGSELRRFGQPLTIVHAKDGMVYAVEQTEAIAAYADACITHEGGKVLLNMLTLADALSVNQAIISFFTDAQKATSN